MLPRYMKNRASSSYDGTLQDLEANVVLAMGNKFSPLSCGVIPTDSVIGLMDVNMAALSDNEECPPEDEHGGDDCTVAKCTQYPLTPSQAAYVVDSSLEDFRMVTPLSTMHMPELLSQEPQEQQRPAKKPRTSHPSKDNSSPPSQTKPIRTSCTLPTADDPIDESFLAKLYTPGEEGKINPSHAIVRRDVLEIRRTRSGRIFFQCGCCKDRPRSERAKQSTLAPQNIGGLYRAMVRFMMYHVPACVHISGDIRELSPKATKTVQAKGTKKYWVESAIELGLRDAEDGRGIVFCKTTGDN
mmetsp:Transcript_3511/g.7663  ORF Transcript_3511/g.7663 Transcript_3511/m.7663 type:complete len:299 (-) Transcript_3511:345-1241(-)